MANGFFYWVGLITTTIVATAIAGVAGGALDYVIDGFDKKRKDPFNDVFGYTNKVSDRTANCVIEFLKVNYDKIKLERISDSMLNVSPNTEVHSKICYAKVNDIEVVNMFRDNYHVYTDTNDSLEFNEVVLVFEGDISLHGFLAVPVESEDEDEDKDEVTCVNYHVFKFNNDIGELLHNARHAKQSIRYL